MISPTKFAMTAALVGAMAMLPATRAWALTESQAMERLNGVPVFTITDAQGTPLLGTLPKPQGQGNANQPEQLMLFFLNPADAETTLGQIRQRTPDVGGRARVTVISMNDAYKAIEQNKNNKKVGFQIVPSQASLDSAKQVLTANGRPNDRLPTVPVFFAVGGQGNNQGMLTLEQGGKQLVPFFFERSDLQTTLDRARQGQPQVAQNAKIQVTSLFQVLDAMVSKDNKPNPDAERFTFIPGRSAVEFVARQQPNPPAGGTPAQPRR
ncbi:MAG: hypothetical protein HC918_11800 [Oscillatoriales cyanobacterium SM2_1_8]|nr:hypothetical protein [Oscillatoriales cyanobacterium SM2_1_8]